MRTTVTQDYVPSMSMRASVVRDAIKRIDDVYVGRIETQLLHWGTRIHDLAAHAEVERSDVPVARNSDITDLESKYKSTQTQLAAWKTACDMKRGTCAFSVKQAWNNLESAFEDLRSSFTRMD